MATYYSPITGNFCTNTTWFNYETGTRGVQGTTSATTNTLAGGYVYNADAQDMTGTNAKSALGIYMHCKQTTTTGTVSISFSADSGTTATKEVTVNANILPTTASWVFFQFDSALALDGGTDYALGIKASSAGNATFSRDATAANWSHILVWNESPAAAPTTGDVLNISGAVTTASGVVANTVTMDETATTAYGAVSVWWNGTLSWDTTAAHNPVLRLGGSLSTGFGGTVSIGTSGTPIPRDSVAVLEFVCASDSQFGTSAVGGTWNIQGLSRTSGKNVMAGLLNVDTVNGEGHFHIDTDTGWLSGDTVAIASTSNTASQCETKILSGDAGAEIVNVTVNFGATVHSGTAPTQGEVFNMTRNVIVRSTSSSNMFALNLSGATTTDIDWAEFYYYDGGYFSTTANISYSSFHDSEDWAFNVASGSGTISYNCFYNVDTANPTASPYYPFNISGAITFDHNYIMKATVGTGDTYPCIVNLISAGATTIFTNNTISSCNSIYPALKPRSTSGFTIDGAIVHSNAGVGIKHHDGITNFTVKNSTIWRNANVGLNLYNSNYYQPYQWNGIVVENCIFFGNTTSSIQFNSQSASYMAEAYNVVFDRVTSNGDSSFGTTNGVQTASMIWWFDAKFYDCDFSTASGIKTAHTNDINMAYTQGEIVADNCKFGGAISGNLVKGIKSNMHNQIKGGYQKWTNGTITTDTTAYNDGTYTNTAPSERVTPSSASVRQFSGSKKVAVASGATVTINVYVRKSNVGDGDAASYNGADQPRLMIKRSGCTGLTADTVGDTMTAAIGDWEQLTYTSPAATKDGVMEFYVDCDGTTGWINIDAWSLT